MTLPPSFPPSVCRAMFDGVRVSTTLPYPLPPSRARYTGTGQHRSFSFSGAQDKYSMVLDDHVLRYRNPDERGSFILKPCPSDAFMPHRADAPANEALCMNISRRVFRIPTALCALCRFQNGSLAYLTKRFDYAPNGSKLHLEDFSSLLSPAASSPPDKYDFSYEDLAASIRLFSSSPQSDILRFFRIVLLNFLLCNGDAHLKNFAMLGPSPSSLRLAPAYDIMNTRIHVQDDTFAPSRGLFADSRPSPRHDMRSFFISWAQSIGIPTPTASRILSSSLAKQPQIEHAVSHSALSRKAQKAFLLSIRPRFKSLLPPKMTPNK